MKKWIVASVVFPVVIGLILLFACTRRGRKYSPDTLTIGIARDWNVSDIWLHRGENCLVFETLVRRDKKGGYIPFIAESWEKSEDGKDYTFRIRDGVTFSDGTRVTAYHVKESFVYREKNKEKIKAASGQQKGRYQDIEWAQADSLPIWSDGSSVEVLDEYTIRFHLPQPYNVFLDELATTHISPVLKPSQDGKSAVFIGTGPYIVCEQKGSHSVLLVRNPHYWQGEVRIPRIVLKVIPDSTTRAIALRTGDIDLTGIDSFDQIPLEMIPQLDAGNLSVERISSLNPAVHSLALNYQQEPFTDINVRKAIAMIISQNKINDFIHEAGVSIDGPVPQNNALSNRHIIRRRNNVDGARQMLAEAGWTDLSADGTIMKDGKRFSVTLFYNSHDPVYKAVAEGIKSQLKKAGIAVQLQHMEFGALGNRMRNKTFEMALWPQMDYQMFYYSKRPCGFTVYQSPELDDAFSIFLHSNDPSESREAFYLAQELIVKSCAQPFFFETFNVVAWNSKRLCGFDPLPLEWSLGMDLWKAQLSKNS
ncbi:MAG: ABC transporter substrate-binding protein [bacterium]